MKKVTNKENPNAPDSKEGQAALAREVVNENPRKMSEIIKDKREALKRMKIYLEISSRTNTIFQ